MNASQFEEASISNSRSLAPALLLLCGSLLIGGVVASSARAQAIYSRRNADGTIVFSNAPTDATFEPHSGGKPPAPISDKVQPTTNPPLVAAICEGQNAANAKKLIESGGNVSQRGLYGRTALHCAAEQHMVEMVVLLLDHGAEVDAKTSNLGRTPLHLAAAASGTGRVIELLVAHGADVEQATPTGQTALHLAADDGQKEALRALLARRANTAAKDEGGRTPLHMAKDGATAALLVDAGAPLNAVDQQGETPLHSAAQSQHLDVVKILLAHGADANAKNRFGLTPMRKVAAGTGNQIVEALVDHGALQ
jgi:ankyrin repeat protein